MNLFAQSGWIKFLLIVFLLLLGAGSLVYNNYLVGKILNQERKSVELWAKAIEFNALPVHQQSSTQLIDIARELMTNPDISDSLVAKVLEIETLKSSTNFVTDELILDESGYFNIPAVVVDSNDVPLESSYLSEVGDGTVSTDYYFKNIPIKQIDTPEERAEMVQELKRTNPPIKIILGDENTKLAQFVYYGESPTVRILRFFPYVQILIMSLLLAIGYTTYKSITRTEQSNLWVGMAKEAAHQLGTPISSLYGWIHLFKDEFSKDDSALHIVSEIENDVQRLSGVAERFGKIGSAPELTSMNIKPILEDVVGYMERRLPRLGKAVEVKKNLDAEAEVQINPELFQWAIENLVKNAMDALNHKDNQSFIGVYSKIKGREIIIDIEDSGAGIEPQKFKTVFRPGFSTKKRGWGLGLSLTKRIIEEYHKGKIFVLRSELGAGTVMRIVLAINEEKN